MPLNESELKAQTPQGFPGNEEIQDTAASNLAIDGLKRGKRRASSAGQSRPSTGFRLRVGRSGDGDHPLAGQPRFVLVPVAGLHATPVSPWLAKDGFGIRDSRP